MLCYSFILALIVLFLLKILKKITVPDPNALPVDQEKVSKYMNCFYNCLNHTLHKARTLFLFEDKCKSYKALFGLIATYFLSRHLSDSTMIWIAIDIAFSISFVIWMHPESVSAVKGMAGMAKDLISSVCSKIPQNKEKSE